jgi:hypothetical protein
LKDHYKVAKIAVDNESSGLKEDLEALKETSSDGELSRDLTALFLNMPLSDVELEIEGKSLKAHKNILWSNFILNIYLDVFNIYIFRSINGFPSHVFSRYDGINK